MTNAEFSTIFPHRYKVVLDHLVYGQYYEWNGWSENVQDQIAQKEADLHNAWYNACTLEGQTVAILGGGFGFFSVPLAFAAGARQVDLYDMCPITEELSWQLNSKYDNFTHHQTDVVFDREYVSQHDVYINTSVEHMYHMRDIVPSGSYMIMAASTSKKRGHINRCNFEQLVESTGMQQKYGIEPIHIDNETCMIMGCR